MVASRYQGSFGYAPRMASGSYPSGGPRNALAPVYGAPVGSVGSPIGMPQAPAMQAPMAPAAPSLTSGTGQLRDLAQERYLAEGNGVGFGSGQQDGFDPGDGYGTGGPTGAPSTGNFGQDVMNFGRNAGPAVAGLLGGPPGLFGVALGIGAAGALRGLGYERPANALIGNVIGVQGLDGGRGAGTSEGMGLGATDAPPDTSGAGFGGGYDTGFAGLGTGQGLAGIAPDQAAPAPDAGGDGGGFGGESPGMGLGGTDAPAGTSGMDFGGGYGDFGGYGDYGGFGGYGGDNGGDGGSQGESAGNGTGDNAGDSKRYGGMTRRDTDGVLDEVPIRAHENEYVVRPEATMHYGEDIMHALNSGMIPRNALAALAMQRRPQAANHLLQMMMR